MDDCSQPHPYRCSLVAKQSPQKLSLSSLSLLFTMYMYAAGVKKYQEQSNYHMQKLE